MFVKSEFEKTTILYKGSDEVITAYIPSPETLVFHWERAKTISDVWESMTKTLHDTVEEGAYLYSDHASTAMDKIRDEARKWRKRGIQLQTLVRNQWDLDYENLKKDLNDIAKACREEREAQCQ
tara:strand:- start:210 stop:581 length:372 start_codon:yes stop_codon:yes gene_type:complete